MNARFRVRLRDGGDLTVNSLEGLFERVACGVIGRHDLIHDSLTGQWAPAGTLPVYWLCTDLLAHGVPPGTAEGQPRVPPVAVPPVAVPTKAMQTAAERREPAEDDLATEDTAESVAPEGSGLSLADPAPMPTPEEAAHAFIARMEEERAQDREAPALDDLSTLGVEETGATGGSAAGRSGASKGGRSGASKRGRPGTSTARAPAAGNRPSDFTRSTSPGEVPEIPRPAVRPLRRRRVRRPHEVSVALAVVLGTVGLAGGVGLAWPGLGSSGGPAVADAQAAAAPRVVPPTEGEIRSGAYQAFCTAVERRAAEVGIGPIPDVWLEGRYLADAQAYPEVEAYWTTYGDFLEEVRREEGQLYRAGYLDEVAAAGFSGPVRNLRLATAMADFTAGRGDRESVYREVGELIDAALALHALSAQAAGRISYEPARANRVSADPVIEATGTDQDMQAALDAALDRVLLALHGEVEGEGPGREGVEGWLVSRLVALGPGGTEAGRGGPD